MGGPNRTQEVDPWARVLGPEGVEGSPPEGGGADIVRKFSLSCNVKDRKFREKVRKVLRFSKVRKIEEKVGVTSRT